MSVNLTIPTTYSEIQRHLDRIDPIRYSKSRNFINGAVTNLSPYISRGVIDTKQIFQHLAIKGFKYRDCERFIQQLIWREYFQRVWQMKGEDINLDIKRVQEQVNHQKIPVSIINATTGINAIDESIENLKSNGMMHNHLRMYCAFLCCNLGQSHWLQPAKWMYYHLLDADWGSNALSWQWVAGTFSSKKYIANQENINHYTGTTQVGTPIDISYEALQQISVPEFLKKTMLAELITPLTKGTDSINLNPDLPLLIYNFYNLSQEWRSDILANRVLLLEPEIFEQYPISEKSIEFMLQLSKNIEGIQIFIGSFSDLKCLYNNDRIYYREHPLNSHYIGIQDERSWILPEAMDAHGSYTSFWKKHERRIRDKFESFKL